MPKPGTATAAPVADPIPAAVLPPTDPATEREVVYPHFEVAYFFDGEGILPEGVEAKGPITYDVMKQLLMWEGEDEYANRMREENPGVEGVIEYAKDFLLIDEDKRKVRCWSIEGNRPFDEKTAKSYCQSVLTRTWAGPTCMPGETPNGETLIVSRTGRVESGQHRGVGFMLAVQKWRKEEYWKQFWPEEPVMDALVVFGVSEDPRVVQTLDNVRPRSASDVLYTSPVFRDLGKRQKQECSRIMAKCIDILWKRTWAGSDDNTRFGAETNAEIMRFAERHPHIQEAVRHIYEEDKGRKITDSGIDSRYAAAMLYFMGSSGSDSDAYAAAETPGEEEGVDWTNWDTAKAFWVDVAKEEKGSLLAVQMAVKALGNPETGVKASHEQVMAVVALAWAEYVDGKPVRLEDLSLDHCYLTKPSGERIFGQYIPSFGGLDLGIADRKVDPAVPPAQVEDTKKKTREKAAADLLATKKASNGTVTLPLAKGGAEALEQLEDLHQRFPGAVILFRTDKEYKANGEDAAQLGQLVGLAVKAGGIGKYAATFPLKELDGYVTRLNAAGVRVAVAVKDGDNITVAVYEVKAASPESNGHADPTPTAEPKPAAAALKKKPPVKPTPAPARKGTPKKTPVGRK